MQDASFDPVVYLNTPRWQGVKLGLERIAGLMELLGNPQDRLRFVHVAGTNGKGSTSCYLASILQQAGYKTGLFTSPYIEEFNERIRVDGANIDQEALRRITLQVRDAASAMEDHPTAFELMTAVALLYFAERDCDICVMEVGMGGRLDSTNVIQTVECSVITSIALDHCAELGNTVEAIAGEKAGIVKEGVPVVSYRQEPGVAEVLRQVSSEHKAPLQFLDLDDVQVVASSRRGHTFNFDGLVGLHTDLLGTYQPYNGALAVAVVRVLVKRGWRVSEGNIRAGLAMARWPGRFERVSANPDIIVDGGHNPQGVGVLLDSLACIYPGVRPVFLVGLLADKDYPAMVGKVIDAGIARGWVCAAPPNPRALPAQDLAAEVVRLQQQAGCNVQQPVVAATYDDAMAAACRMAGANGLVVAFGSLYAVADVKAAVRNLES